jgi:CubicO group peptidase (beta-lactamase class C family)
LLRNRTLVFALVTFNLATSRGKAGEFDSVRELVQQVLVRDSVPSVALAVSRGDTILWEAGFGWADRESQVHATEHTLYPLASITKPLTATALMVLRERASIDLDRPVNDYLGDSALLARVGDSAQATVRRVANHTAGLPTHYQTFYADEPDRPPPMPETIRRYGLLMRPPGERFSYSNLGYGVLGHLIARVSGAAYPDFLWREVFLPLGMTRAAIGVSPRPDPDRAILYGTDGRRLPSYESAHPAAADAWSSAHDLVRFGMFHLKAMPGGQRPILPDRAVDEMQQPTATMGRDGYGIGWVIADRKGCRTVRHGGGMAGAQTQLVLVPEAKVAVVVLVNVDNRRPVDEVTEAVLDAVLQGPRTDSTPGSKKPSATTPATKSDLSKLSGEWKGPVQTHRGPLSLVLRVRDSGDVHVRLGDQLWTLLNEPKFDGAVLTGKFQGDIRTPDANRRPYHLHVDLTLRGESLTGALAAISLPASRGGALAYWAELKRR